MRFLKDWKELTVGAVGLDVTWLEEQGALVVTKSRPGFDQAGVGAIAAILRRVAMDGGDALKFLVFDFAHDGAGATQAPEGFADIVAVTSDLIVDTPVITLAWARGLMGGLDFDFAMNCSAVVAESSADFSFAGDPFDLLGLYAALGRRIGFARAERLIESDRALSPQEARDLLLVRDVAPARPGHEGIAAYLAQFERRYNASHAIYRAQRMAEPPIDRRPLLVG
ncbi:MAG: enoyl-CoA hydratase-related protein [Methylocystis sp.]|uniref:enoyl-CoA hydratase-related protein n=1 Tax=Methylocystis sp. TaxID=1911079 RepID=UPI003DA63E1C